MTNWQECYKNNLRNKSIKELQNIIKDKELEIKHLDKRTYNGRMGEIFIGADILAIKELIDEKLKEREKTFSAFYPTYGNKNPSIRYFIHFGNTKKELKHLQDDIYFYNENRQRVYVKKQGGMWHEKFTEIGVTKLWELTANY
jgi:hypothetical protein